MQKNIEIYEEETLVVRINKLRTVLNEMCCNNREEKEEEKFILSRYLDQLICEYMLSNNTDSRKQIDTEIMED